MEFFLEIVWAVHLLFMKVKEMFFVLNWDFQYQLYFFLKMYSMEGITILSVF
jgi:hypothetical protein